MLGALESQDGTPERWQVSTSWRYQESDRHFRGSEEQKERREEGSEVINTIHLLELGISYQLDSRWSFALGIPYLDAERSSPIRDANRVVVDRSVTAASGVGDITLSARRLLWKPEEHPKGNVLLGLGLKFPTGSEDVEDTRERLVGGQRVSTVESVDQSIQPGDGGFGVILNGSFYRHLFADHGALYGSATYLLNAENTNGVPTFRNNPGEEVMSIADQYLARAGLSYSGAKWKGLGVSLGGRVEGIPAEDLIGDSDGFRRPGYAVSVEPGLSFAKGSHTFSLAVPVAAYRNRVRSVPDRLEPGRHGDAAFADYVVFAGYWRRF